MKFFIWPINSGVLTSLLLPHLSSPLIDSLASLDLLCHSKTDARFMQDGRKAVWSIPYVLTLTITPLAHPTPETHFTIFKFAQSYQERRRRRRWAGRHFLSLRIITLLFSSSSLYSQSFGPYVLRLSSGVSCLTREPTQNRELNPVFNSDVLNQLTITSVKLY